MEKQKKKKELTKAEKKIIVQESFMDYIVFIENLGGMATSKDVVEWSKKSRSQTFRDLKRLEEKNLGILRVMRESGKKDYTYGLTQFAYTCMGSTKRKKEKTSHKIKKSCLKAALQRAGYGSLERTSKMYEDMIREMTGEQGWKMPENTYIAKAVKDSNVGVLHREEFVSVSVVYVLDVKRSEYSQQDFIAKVDEVFNNFFNDICFLPQLYITVVTPYPYDMDFFRRKIFKGIRQYKRFSKGGYGICIDRIFEFYFSDSRNRLGLEYEKHEKKEKRLSVVNIDWNYDL